MNAVDVVVAVAGLLVLTLMMSGMFLLTSSGTVAVHAEGSDGQGSNLSPTAAPGVPAGVDH